MATIISIVLGVPVLLGCALITGVWIKEISERINYRNNGYPIVRKTK